MSDEALVRRMRAGEQRAFSLLYRRYAPVLARRLRRVLGHTQDVEDALQMTFTELFRSLPRYREDLPFGPWIHRIAFRVAGTCLRTRRRRWWSQSRGEIEWAGDPHALGVEERAIQHDLLRHLFAAMEHLSADKRIAFALHELEGLSHTEIAQLQGTSPQTVWARVQSARKDVAKRLGHLELDLLRHNGGES